MKYIKEYLKDVIKVKPLGELTTKDDELNGISGEMVYIDGKCSDIFIAHIDYVDWLEKQSNKSINIDIESMVSSYKQRLKSQAGIRMENNPLVNMCSSAFRRGVENTLEELNLRTLEKQGEQEFINSDTLIQQRVDTLADIDAKQSSADNVKPKVKNEIEVDSYCQKNCRGFQETGKCFADGECKAKREAESTDKVEQSSINEIEIPFGAKDSELQEAIYHIPKGFYAEIDDDKVVIKKGEKPTAWSKKDEKMFEYALNMIEWYSGKNEDKSRFVSDWLKSIKQRIGE